MHRDDSSRRGLGHKRKRPPSAFTGGRPPQPPGFLENAMKRRGVQIDPDLFTAEEDGWWNHVQSVISIAVGCGIAVALFGVVLLAIPYLARALA